MLVTDLTEAYAQLWLLCRPTGDSEIGAEKGDSGGPIYTELSFSTGDTDHRQHQGWQTFWLVI